MKEAAAAAAPPGHHAAACSRAPHGGPPPASAPRLGPLPALPPRPRLQTPHHHPGQRRRSRRPRCARRWASSAAPRKQRRRAAGRDGGGCGAGAPRLGSLCAQPRPAHCGAPATLLARGALFAAHAQPTHSSGIRLYCAAARSKLFCNNNTHTHVPTCAHCNCNQHPLWPLARWLSARELGCEGDFPFLTTQQTHAVSRG